MNTDRIRLFRERLLQQREGLVKIQNHFEKDATDFETREGAEAMSQDEFMSIASHELDRIKQIEGALDRINRGVFGICIRCDTPIPVAGLELSPEREHCVDCETELERERAHKSHSPMNERHPEDVGLQ